MTTRSILDLKAGDTGRIGRVVGRGSIRQRLLDMGLLPKQEIRLKRMAPRGGPVWIELNGTQLALRREEASSILMSSE
jgi:Fe2+ transport system protein FeoA